MIFTIGHSNRSLESLTQRPAEHELETPAMKRSVSKTRLYQLLKKGQFPRQVRISPGRVAWVSSEVARWIEERIAER